MKWLRSAGLGIGLMLLAASIQAQPADRQPAGDDESLCFDNVPGIEHCIEPEFEDAWRHAPVGGQLLTREQSILYYGYPLSDGRHELNADAECVFTQWFERAAFEAHPSNPPPYDVLLRRLGAEILDRTTVTKPNPCD